MQHTPINFKNQNNTTSLFKKPSYQYHPTYFKYILYNFSDCENSWSWLIAIIISFSAMLTCLDWWSTSAIVSTSNPLFSFSINIDSFSLIFEFGCSTNAVVPILFVFKLLLLSDKLSFCFKSFSFFRRRYFSKPRPPNATLRARFVAAASAENSRSLLMRSTLTASSLSAASSFLVAVSASFSNFSRSALSFASIHSAFCFFISFILLLNFSYLINFKLI